jgi:hypothetical protein
LSSFLRDADRSSPPTKRLRTFLDLEDALRSLDPHLDLRTERGEEIVVCRLCGPQCSVMQVRHAPQ